ncbi:type II secretion system secretin GspD [Mesorhizobium sp. CC13]|uniref:type II secretion system secretin GspD n=1 Tax=Mesorhizobium sp. CC13 TaxID=3029194 RepID=UPI0032642254
MRNYNIIAISAALVISGCSLSGGDFFSETVDSLHAKNSPLRNTNPQSQSLSSAGGQAAKFSGAQYKGSGNFVSYGAPMARVTGNNAGQYELNLVNAPVADAAKAVLGDALQANYVVDPRVQGTVTLQTSKPVSQEVLVDILESALAVNGAGIVRRAGTYQIVPLSETLSSTPAVSVPSVSPAGPGVKVQVIELQYIAAEEMKTILEPITRQGSVLRVDPTRNLITVAGNNADLNAIREAISVFDVDWMRGMSVALHPLKTSKPSAVASELESIFGTNGGPGANLIKFIPNERLNAVLVITSRPAYLSRAASWIAKLDKLAQTNEDQLFVYQIQNRPAKELADVLTAVLGSSRGKKTIEGGSSLSPEMTPVALASDGVTPLPLTGLSSDMEISPNGEPAPKVVADVENNALLIQTTARTYERIEQILARVDVLPTQVMLEAVIAEVALNDELKFGMRWFFESNGFKVSLSDVASGFTGAAFPGFAWSYATDNIQVTLNALSSVTDVNVISAPTLMALNNQKAVLQIGDQVPIITQQAIGTANPNAPIVNSVQMKDTGVILSVTPRINNAGRVMLDISQEVSNVVKTTTSGIDSPTIQQRKIDTKVLVNDGESLALGGLIQERNNVSRGQVPLLGDIPILGNAFKNKTDSITRTELIVFIRPRVVRNIPEARAVTDEFRGMLSLKTPIQKRRGGATRTEQDLKRLAY